MTKTLEIIAGIGVEVFFVLLALGLLYRVWGLVLPIPKRHVILVFQRGILLKNGQLEKTLDPGTHWVSSRRTVLVQDMRPKPFQINTQDMLAADGMGVRISLSGEYRISNLNAFLTASSDAFSSLFIEIRQALRIAVAEMNGNAILSQQTAITTRIRELIVPRAEQLGCELMQVEIWEAVPLGWLSQQ